MNFQDAIEKVREYHRQYGLPAADAPELLPTDGLKAMRLSVGLINLWMEIRGLPFIREVLIPPSAKEDLLVRFALGELDLLGQWLKAHVQGDLDGARFAWAKRFHLLLRQAAAAGFDVEELFTLTHNVIGSAPPTDGEDRQGQPRTAP
jgi:hypothetical protein